MTIAVIGATGNTGRALVKELRALGQNPVCVIRNGEKASEVLGADAKTVVAELTDRPALGKALYSVQSVFVVTGHNPGMVEQQNYVLNAGAQGRRPISGAVSGHRSLGKADSESPVGRGHASRWLTPSSGIMASMLARRTFLVLSIWSTTLKRSRFGNTRWRKKNTGSRLQLQRRRMGCVGAELRNAGDLPLSRTGPLDF